MENSENRGEICLGLPILRSPGCNHRENKVWKSDRDIAMLLGPGVGRVFVRLLIR